LLPKPQNPSLKYSILIFKMKIINKQKIVDDHIDEVIVRHILQNQDQKKYGEYIDLDEYERYRVVMKKCYNRRRQRSAVAYSVNNSGGCKPLSFSKEFQNSLEN